MGIEKPKRKAGIFGSIFTQANASLGAGILGFPYAFASAGLATGILSTIILVILSGFTLIQLFQYAHRVNASSYQECIHIFLGKYASSLAQLILMVYLVGACIVYLAVMYDCVSPFMLVMLGEDSILVNRAFLVPALCLIFVFPICLLKDISALAPTSILAVLGVVYLTIFTCVQFIIDRSQGVELPDIDWTFNFNTYANILPEYFLSIPIIAFAFQCHVLLIPVYASLKNPTQWKMILVIVVSLILCFTLYVVTGLFGYLSYGEETDGDILLNYPALNYAALVGRLLVGVTSMFSYPISSFTTRLVIESFFLKNRNFKTWEYYAVTILFTAVCTLGAIFLTEISNIFGIIGSFGAVSLMFIFPGLILTKSAILRLFGKGVAKLPKELIGKGYYPTGVSVEKRNEIFIQQIEELKQNQEEVEQEASIQQETTALLSSKKEATTKQKKGESIVPIEKLTTIGKIRKCVQLIWGISLIILGVFMGTAGIVTTIVKYIVGSE